MIKIEFNPLGSWDRDMMNIAEYADYTGVEFKSKNLESKSYQGRISSVFLATNALNLIIFTY
jgi:hypothetical protein